MLRAGAWDDPEGWDGEGGGRGVQDREHMYTFLFKEACCMEMAMCPNWVLTADKFCII